MTVVRSILESIGLNPKEIEIYLLLLQTGGSTASGLARRMKIPTSTAQYTCQQLLKKGLVRMIQKSNMYLFGAHSPRKLLELVNQQEEALHEKRESLERIIGELEGLMSPDTVLPKVKFFEGREGIIEAYKEVIADMEEGGEAISYVNPLDLTTDSTRMKPVFEKVYNEFARKKVRTRVIMPVSPQAMTYLKDEKKNLEEHRFVPDGTFQCMPTEVILYRDKMYCMTSQDNQVFATILQNAGIVAMQRAIFEMAWERAEDHHKKILATKKK
jgi:HTH-type transcriptional regulator, sugar sensing transcriptional regulator